MFDCVFQHDGEPGFFVVAGYNKGKVDFIIILKEVILTRKFLSFKGIDDDGFVLSAIEVLFPVFVGLDEPKYHYNQNETKKSGNILEHDLECLHD